jgi:hypothetical protein
MKSVMIVKPVYLALVLALQASYLRAHEVDTHAQLGVKAWQQSSLVTDPIVRANLGLDRLQVNAPFRSYPPLLAAADPRADDYFDVTAALCSSVSSISSPSTFGGTFRSPTLADSPKTAYFLFNFRAKMSANIRFLDAPHTFVERH